MSYKTGKELKYKGHNLGELYDSITPSPIVYHTNEIETIAVIEDTIWTTREKIKHPGGFGKINVSVSSLLE